MLQALSHHRVLPCAVQGDAVVMIEHRSGSSDAYGQGKKAPMPLRDFIARMQKGDSNLYLSTQEVRALGPRARMGSISTAAYDCVWRLHAVRVERVLQWEAPGRNKRGMTSLQPPATCFCP